MNFSIVGAIFRKDVRSLLALVALTTLLFLADALISRLDLLPVWSAHNAPVVMAAVAVLLLSVFQLDSAASLEDDWLCRPIGKRELLAAKLLLCASVVYLPRAAGTLIADLSLGFPLSESLLDAFLLQDALTLFLLPIFLSIAIVTRTLVQGLGVLLALFICVFALPTPFVRPPGPLSPGINDALFFSGMQWLATAPARLATITILCIGMWLVYWRRQVSRARLLMVAGIFVTLLLLLLPMAFLPWKSTFAVQSAFSPAPAAETARISLRYPRACFPATHRSALSTDAAFAATVQRHRLSLWDAEELRDAGPDSVAFLTAVEPRAMPLDARVKLNYVQADFSADGAALYSLRPAQYLTDSAGDGLLAHAWMLPEGVVQRLRGLTPQLTLTYSMTLLQPREYDVPTDGRRHALPGLGWCGARIGAAGNQIDVDCFTAFTSAVQVSAQLNEIPASRIYGAPDFAPPFAKLPYGQRKKLSIRSPRLASHESITVTAWHSAGTLEKSLTTPGILGAAIDTCPLPAADGGRFVASHWRDAAPHAAQSITTDAGVQLEVLDFGGESSPDNPPMLLLPGLGATAHSYDEFAPLLARRHRVIAMTRRGTGWSSRPDFGFDTPTLGRDVLRVMDAMHLEKVVLVGHSIAGDELTWLGGNHPLRVSALVYLDAGYDRSGDPRSPTAVRLKTLGRLLPPEPPLPPQALRNFDAMNALLRERGHTRVPEGELIAFFHMNQPDLAGTPAIDGRTQQAISAAIRAPDYRAVKIPALAIYASENPASNWAPWYDPNDLELVAYLEERASLMNAMKRESIESFRKNVEKGRVIELPNATHYIFQSNPSEVLDAIEKFAVDRQGWPLPPADP
jgi:pimeloyl-ACP methyl ester carboxylesterase